ncbi:MAG: pseudouridine synthase [Hyphomicrobiales bacterium]|nr:pseudouridine synthase [Hyphomicrobiales bacterium]
MNDRDKRQGGRPFKSGAAKSRPFGKRPSREVKAGPPPKAQEGERIAKAMARAGACSRRDAEEWIAAGRVAVNGRVLESPAFNVTASDRITIDGKPLAARERTRLFLFHKPRGLVTTDRDPEGRSTVFDYLAERHPDLPRLMSVGRLDINTEGLLLLTNDGGLARTLELPATGWLRRYRVRAHGETNQAALDALAKGVSIDDVDYAPIEAKLDRVQGANSWITLGLREGKNREVRRVLGSLGLDVNRLIRVSYGPFQLGELAEGAVDEVKTRVLRDQLGPALIAQSLADFDTPAREQEDRERRSPRPRSEDRTGRLVRDRVERFSRERRFESDEEEPKKRERPKPAARKHVTTIRAERADRLKNERVKVERGATEDRKGRTIAVERVISAEPKAAPDNRNGRRFKAERDGDRPMRRKPRENRAEGARGFEGRGPRREEKNGGDKRFGDRRPPRNEEGPRSSRRNDESPRVGARDNRRERERGFEGRGPRRGDRTVGEKGVGDRRPGRQIESARPPRRDDESSRTRTREARPEVGRRFDKGAPRRDDMGGGDKRFSRGKPSGARPPRRTPPKGDGPRRGPPRGRG